MVVKNLVFHLLFSFDVFAYFIAFEVQDPESA